MTLTTAQTIDVRRFAGYAVPSTVQALTANTDTVFCHYGMIYMSLFTRLTTLDADSETRLGTYLTNLTALESAIIGAGANLDTASAAVWTRNANEVRDRTALYTQYRLEMCAFLGLKPGPGLNAGGRMVRG